MRFTRRRYRCLKCGCECPRVEVKNHFAGFCGHKACEIGRHPSCGVIVSGKPRLGRCRGLGADKEKACRDAGHALVEL
jgi:hypothetical protein